ncbi:MAG: hypothetical protein AAB864_01420 [Patescibacteria group bacterium]
MDTHHKDETVIDNYLRAHFIRDTQLIGGIEPSRDFVPRTLRRIKAYDHRRQIVQDSVVVMLTGLPVFLRQTWLWFRQDYFSVASLPFGHTIKYFYELFLSAMTLYGLAALGLVVLASYVMKFRKSFMIPARQFISW